MTDNKGEDGKDAGKKKKVPDKPPVKPDVTPPVTPPTDPPRTEETITVTKQDFVALQKQILELQKQATEAETTKDDGLRKYTLEALKTINPKLAIINKDASLSTLQTVIATANEIKNDFPSLDQKDKPPPKATAEDHDSMDFDFEKQEFIFN